MATSYGPREDFGISAAVAARRGSDYVEYSGTGTVPQIVEPDGVGGHAGGI